MDYLVSLLLLIKTSTVLSDSLTSCRDGWVAYEGSCYLFGHDEVHFTEAEHYCRQHNSHLIHVNSVDENNFIKDKLRDMNHHYWWLGLTDETTEGQWRWFDTDEVATFTDWYPGQPNLDIEDCAVFCDCYNFQWGDIPCTRTCNALCETSGGENPGEVIG